MSEQTKVDEFNARYGIGTPVRYWPGVREGVGRLSRTRSAARVLSGHTAVVWVDGQAGGIALTHVEPEAEAVAVLSAAAHRDGEDAGYRDGERDGYRDGERDGIELGRRSGLERALEMADAVGHRSDGAQRVAALIRAELERTEVTR